MNLVDEAPLALTDEQKKNLEVANRINRETRADPDSLYAGKTIGVWHGQVVAIGDTLDEVSAQLDVLGDKNHEAIVREASADYDAPLWVFPFHGGF